MKFIEASLLFYAPDSNLTLKRSGKGISIHWKACDGMTYHNGPLVDSNGTVNERTLKYIVENKLGDEPDAMDWIMKGIAQLSQRSTLLPHTIGKPEGDLLGEALRVLKELVDRHVDCIGRELNETQDYEVFDARAVLAKAGN